MLAYLAKSIVGAVVVLLVMSFIVFGLQSIIPADPARAMAGPNAPAETVDAMRKQLGLDDPAVVQYGRFLLRLAHGDMGTSVRTRQPVSDDIRQFLPATLELGLASIFLGVALAGIMAALQFLVPGSGGIRLVMAGVVSTPIFLSALLLAYFFWFRLDWFPAAGRLAYRNFAGPTGFNVIDGILVGQPEVSLDALLHMIL